MQSGKDKMDALALLKEVSKREGVNGRIVEALEEAALLIGEEADSLDEQLLEACSDSPKGLVEPCKHTIEAGGKRIRPMLCLSAYRAAGGKEALPMDLAVSAELLHNATLLHDDVIDEGEVRRGRPATRVVHGNAISVLGGDFLLVKTVEMISKRGAVFIAAFIETLNKIIEGELVQLKRRGTTDTTEQEYFNIVEGKTASLFKFSALVGGLAAGAEEKLSRKLGEFGWNTGIAFQLIDDILDLTADSEQLGKSLLADISEGKMTLPVILASRATDELPPLLDELSAGGDPVIIAPKVAELTRKTGSIEKVREQAAKHTALGLGAIDDTQGLDKKAAGVLKELAGALLDRQS